MKKLAALRGWYRLSEAAKSISERLGEDLDSTELLHLALDGKLTLSVNLLDRVKGHFGRRYEKGGGHFSLMPRLFGTAYRPTDKRLTKFDELEPYERKLLESGEVHAVACGTLFDDDIYIEFEDEIGTATGVWDLTMLGAERLDIEHQYRSQSFVTGELDGVFLDGVILKSGDKYFQLLEEFDYDDAEGSEAPRTEVILVEGRMKKRTILKRGSKTTSLIPAGGLPQAIEYVVTIDALAQLEKNFQGAQGASLRVAKAIPTAPNENPEDTLHQKERTTLLLIIAALADIAKVDLSTPNKSAQIILNVLADKGVSLSDRAIENKLKAAQKQIEDRSLIQKQ